MLKNSILLEMRESFAGMEESGQVDLAILDSLSKLRNRIKSIKSKWLEFAGSEGFYFYQAARNVELILDKWSRG